MTTWPNNALHHCLACRRIHGNGDGFSVHSFLA
jgi:hypothetical protein